MKRQGMSGVNGLSFGLVNTPGNSGAAPSGVTAKEKPAGSAAVDDFLAYMKKSLAERMADAWLAAHGLDREKLKAMKPAEREAVLKQMAEELKQELQQATEAAKTGRKTAAA
jgi:hypothetical protein